MADQLPAKVQKELERLEEANRALVVKNKELKGKLTPGGWTRKAHAAGAGGLLALAKRGRLGELGGYEITGADLLPVLDLVIDAATDGTPPGGLAGDLVHTIRLASDTRIVQASEAFIGGGLDLLKAWMNSGDKAREHKRPEPHPAPPSEVINEDGQPVK